MVFTMLPVVPTPAAGGRCEVRALPRDPASVPQARRFVRETLGAWGHDDLEEAGTLLVSELVGNAVLHARSGVEVELAETPEGVVLAVTDDSPVLPVVRRHSREAATGRGLWLLDQYSSRHGVDVTRPGNGKQVWAVLLPESADTGEGSDAALALWLDEVEGL